jgi:AraC-like DNA-binding protein
LFLLPEIRPSYLPASLALAPVLNYSEIQPDKPLSDIVRCFWFLSGDFGGDDGANAAQVVVPDGRLEIILHLADPFRRVRDDGSITTQKAAMVSGQLTSPIRLLPGGRGDICGIRFRATGASCVINTPLFELTNRLDAPERNVAPLVRALADAAARHETPRDRAAAMSMLLLRNVTREPDAAATEAVRQLSTVASPRVGTVADRLGMSARTIERRVREHTGLPPALLRRVIRFRRTFRLLDDASPRTWSMLAQDAGFFDQPHLVRDFREFAGSAPRDFFRQRIDIARAILSSPGRERDQS